MSTSEVVDRILGLLDGLGEDEVIEVLGRVVLRLSETSAVPNDVVGVVEALKRVTRIICPSWNYYLKTLANPSDVTSAWLMYSSSILDGYRAIVDSKISVKVDPYLEAGGSIEGSVKLRHGSSRVLEVQNDNW